MGLGDSPQGIPTGELEGSNKPDLTKCQVWQSLKWRNKHPHFEFDVSRNGFCFKQRLSQTWRHAPTCCKWISPSLLLKSKLMPNLQFVPVNSSCSQLVPSLPSTSPAFLAETPLLSVGIPKLPSNPFLQWFPENLPDILSIFSRKGLPCFAMFQPLRNAAGDLPGFGEVEDDLPDLVPGRLGLSMVDVMFIATMTRKTGCSWEFTRMLQRFEVN